MSGSGDTLGAIDFSQQYSYPEFKPGTLMRDIDGGQWIFIKATAALSAGLMYKILPVGQLGSATAKDDAVDDDSASFVGGFHVAWPQADVASGTYAWARVSGEFTGKLLANVAAGAKLYTSTTAGILGSTASAHYTVVGEALNVTLIGGANALGTIRVAGPAFVAHAANS